MTVRKERSNQLNYVPNLFSYLYRKPAYLVAFLRFNRFAKVSTGITVALVMTVVWPERDAATSNQQGKNIPDEPTAAFGERSRTVHRDPSS